jgi:hypothetical protein
MRQNQRIILRDFQEGVAEFMVIRRNPRPVSPGGNP